MVVYDKKFPVKTLLKKRFQKKTRWPELKFGQSGLAFKKNIRFEFVYFFFMRKFLKRLTRTKKRFFKFSKVWVFVRPNHVMTKKSKNSRMGKGKGNFIRWCAILQKGFIFIEFKNLSPIKLKKYAKKLEKRFKVPLQLVISNQVSSKLISRAFLGSNITLPLTPFMY